jgi:hypothetical protein
MARFLALLPPRSASFSPQRRKSQSIPRPQDVLRSLHQQRPQIGITFLADVQLRFTLSRFPASRLQSQIAAHVAALAEALMAWATFHFSVEREVAKQMAAPAELRTPNMHRANDSLLESADGSMATVATRREKNFVSEKNQGLTMNPEFP